MSISWSSPSRSPIPPSCCPYSPTACTSSTNVIALYLWAMSHNSCRGHTAPVEENTELQTSCRALLIEPDIFKELFITWPWWRCHFKSPHPKRWVASERACSPKSSFARWNITPIFPWIDCHLQTRLVVRLVLLGSSRPYPGLIKEENGLHSDDDDDVASFSKLHRSFLFSVLFLWVRSMTNRNLS